MHVNLKNLLLVSELRIGYIKEDMNLGGFRALSEPSSLTE